MPKKFGDARRSPLVARGAAQALDETELVASEPITVVLSDKGWVRAAKGHDVDAADAGLSRGRRTAACGEGPQHAAGGIPRFDRPQLFDAGAHAAGRARQWRAVDRALLAAARRVVPGARDRRHTTTRLVLASSHGYGFVTALREPHRPQQGRQGDAVARRPAQGSLQPATIAGSADERVVAVTTAGHLLAFAVAELPELDRGKGNKMIEIPKAKLGTERVVAIAVVAPGSALSVKSGNRTMTLSFKDLDAYVGHRASRGGSVAAWMAESRWPVRLNSTRAMSQSTPTD